MKSSFLQWASKLFVTRPSLLFLFDGIGAFLSGILLLFLHKIFRKQIGLPNQLVYSLIAAAFVLFAYSMTCYQLLKQYRPIYFLLIAFSNGIYVLTLLTLLLIYGTKLYGVLQVCFLLESIVIGFLIYWEIKIAIRLKR